MSLRSDFGSVPDRKVPANGKYQAVQTKLDTGYSVSKRPPAMPATIQAQRRDEEFKRIRAATLARMVQELQEEGMESIFNLADNDDRNDGGSQSSLRVSKPPPAKSRAAGSVVSMAGSVVSVVAADAGAAERNLVLLDLREQEDYDRCRVPFAVSYPAAKINRDQFIPELQRCRRDPSKFLVVYHNNDSATAAVATLLVRKGWETVHALSGGFDELVSSYPEILDGDVPERVMASRPPTGCTVHSRSGYSSQSAPRIPGEIRRCNSIPRRSGSVRSASPSSRSSSIRSSSVR
eukprot:TRINITY_DN29199_c0_g1_i1.p1 TRINITY_DN29199_c0_g1~~TRINITY_DN29199_c0_g1_i1.p1  ORF type:complete len:292 (-),score=31.52 TRINITY_DN29199_c0_g1_i1:152-1027(-)